MIWHRGKRCQLVHFGTSNRSVTLNFKLATRQPTWVECKIFLSGWRMNYSSIAPLLALHAGRFGKRKISSHVCARRSHPQQSSDKVISCWRFFLCAKLHYTLVLVVVSTNSTQRCKSCLKVSASFECRAVRAMSANWRECVRVRSAVINR